MSSLFQELKRRNVFRIAIAYVAITWLIIQVADIVFENFGTPEWVMKTLMFLLAIGFPLAVLFAWAFEMTPEGIKREKDVDRSQSITKETGQKLNRTIIIVLLAAVGFLLVDKFMLRTPSPDTEDPVATSDDKSVAVLPFVAMSRGEDDEFFADGLTEEILNSLTRVPDLLVTARTSAFHFKGQDIPIPEIADRLGVAHVVEGSVRRSGDQLRVTAQLIRAADGFHLWSENYDRDTKDTFRVQTDIAEKIAEALGVFMDDQTLARMESEGFRNPEAYIAYQKGVQLYNDAHSQWDITENLEKANVWLDRVIELEATASRAYLARVDYYTHLLADEYDELTDDQRAEAIEQFQSDLNAAVRTASDDMSRVAARFDRATLTGDWRSVRGIVDEFLAIPGCPDASWMNTNTFEHGMAEQVLILSERITECDPQNPFAWWYAMGAKIWLGDYDGAIEIGEKAMRVVDHVVVTNSLATAYIAAGRFDDAEYLLANSSPPDDNAEWRMSVAAARGDVEQVAVLWKVVERTQAHRPDIQLLFLPRIGDRETSNRIAASFDSKPYGYLSLMSVPSQCMCGAPWDIELTPNFKKRIEDAGFAWPPASPINWPMKDW